MNTKKKEFEWNRMEWNEVGLIYDDYVVVLHDENF